MLTKPYLTILKISGPPKPFFWLFLNTLYYCCIFTCYASMMHTSKLLGYIHDDLLVNSEMASLCGGAILPEIQLYCTLQHLAGGLYSDIQFFTGISAASFYGEQLSI
jgi:hypothetical protein